MNTSTEIFDNVLSEVLSRKPCTKERVIRVLLTALEATGFDVEESEYFDHDLVQGELQKLHPDKYTPAPGD